MLDLHSKGIKELKQVENGRVRMFLVEATECAKPCASCEELAWLKCRETGREWCKMRWKGRCGQNTLGLEDHVKDLGLHPQNTSTQVRVYAENRAR